MVFNFDQEGERLSGLKIDWKQGVAVLVSHVPVGNEPTCLLVANCPKPVGGDIELYDIVLVR